MKIIDMNWSPGAPVYTIHCGCGKDFPRTVGLGNRIKCPGCRREANLHTLVRDWEVSLAKPPGLRGILNEVRELYEKWLALPEPERVTKEGEILASRIDELYKEARKIIDKTTARSDK